MTQKFDPTVNLAKLPNVPENRRPTKCGNCPFGGRTVGTRGPEDSPFVIIGESPGSQELMQGYPFVGDSGEMLAATLERVGLGCDDPEPYIINAMQCFPREKEPAIMQKATLACSRRVKELLEAHPRKIILTLGNSAAWTVTEDYGIKITQSRGKLYRHPAASIGAVTTVHPAFLMRNGTFYAAWRRDLEYAVALLKGTDPKAGLWAPPVWSTVQSRDELESLVERMESATHIAGDIETGGKMGAGLHFQRGYILELVVTSNLSNGRHVDIIPGDIIWDNVDLMRRLLGNKAQWIWQNGKFDIKFFRYEGIPEARVDQDTMLLSYAMNENKGHDLDTIAWDWIGAPAHKNSVADWFKSQGIKKKDRDYALIPQAMRREYAAYDVSKTYKAFWPLHEAVHFDKHLAKLYDRILIPASEFLTHVEMRGMRMDLARVEENDLYMFEQLVEPEAKINAYAMQYLGHTINVGSPVQLADLLYNRMKLGAPGSSTDDDSLIKISRRHDHPIALHIQKWRKIAKGRNTYVKNVKGDPVKGKLPWVSVDGRVHITYKLHGTSTGRLSSGDPTNLQNWPRDPIIRGEFVAEEGNVFVEVDLNQAELRCLAIMSNDPTLVGIYRANEVSIHHITSVAMFGENYTDDEKMRAKAVNFGIVYGRTAPSLAEEFDISVREADEYIKIWFARYPVAHKFIMESREAPNELRTMITNFGRKKRWGVVSFDNKIPSENEAANFPHQSTAHDITLLSGIETRPVVKRIWNGDFVNEIHDALYIECANDPNVYGPMISYMQSVMTRVPRDWGLTRVPFLAEAKVGTRWGGRKNAKDAGITDPAELSQYMGEFVPTDEHRARAVELLRSTVKA